MPAEQLVGLRARIASRKSDVEQELSLFQARQAQQTAALVAQEAQLSAEIASVATSPQLAMDSHVSGAPMRMAAALPVQAIP